MSIEVNGVTLPDIPSDVLAQYPYACIGYMSLAEGGTFYHLVASDSAQAYISPEVMSASYGASLSCGAISPPATSTVVFYLLQTNGTEVGTEWQEWVADETESPGYIMIGEIEGYMAESLLWSNHDIYTATAMDGTTGEITVGTEIYFASSVSDPNYYAPKSWYDGMAQQVMRLTGTSDKLTTDEMLEDLKGVEVGGGLAENERIYQVGTAASTLDSSTLIFESTAS